MNPEQIRIRRNLGLTDEDNRLRLKPHINLSDFSKINNYGMKLVKLKKDK